MKLFEPQIKLIKEALWKAPDNFYLHAVTYCDHIHFLANGHDPIPTELDENGVWQIGLHILHDHQLPEFRCVTPVVHTIPLGPFPGGEGGDIEVSLFIDSGLRARGEEEKPKTPVVKTTVSTTDANEASRPIEDI